MVCEIAAVCMWTVVAAKPFLPVSEVAVRSTAARERHWVRGNQWSHDREEGRQAQGPHRSFGENWFWMRRTLEAEDGCQKLEAPKMAITRTYTW